MQPKRLAPLPSNGTSKSFASPTSKPSSSKFPVSSSCNRDEKKQRLEEEMRRIKAISPADAAKVLFATRVVGHNEYLGEKLKDQAEPYSAELAEQVAQIHGQALTKALAEICADVEDFLRTLYREHPSVEENDIKPHERPSARMKKAGTSNHRSSKGPVESQFVSLLSEGTKCSRPRFAQEDIVDEAEDQPRKNRKGQRARRAEWERLYGTQARHLRAPIQHARKTVELEKPRGPKKPRESREPKELEERHRPATEKSRCGMTGEKLHPSWEAKRKQKAMLLEAASGHTMNKRIKFADDGI